MEKGKEISTLVGYFKDQTEKPYWDCLDLRRNSEHISKNMLNLAFRLEGKSIA